MPVMPNSQENKKLNELVKQVNMITKIVDELQEEVDTLKLNKCRNKNSHSTSTRFKMNDNKLNSSPFQRLRFFRKNDNKTNENIDSSIKLSENIHDKTMKDVENPNLFQSDQRKRKSRSVQTKIYTDEIIEIPELVCAVKTCSVQTERDYTKNRQKITSDKITKNKSAPPCHGCAYKNKTKSRDDKNIKSSKLKRGSCARNCPYLSENKSVQCKYKMKDASNTAKKRDKKKYFKNKKIMVDLTQHSKYESSKRCAQNCQFLENADFNNLIDKPKDNKCKHCHKKCKSKNVVKIKKAILTQEPPMIIVSPHEYKTHRGNCCKKKSFSTNCKKILRSLKNETRDCVQNDELSESFNLVSCPCLSFVDPIENHVSNGYSEEIEDYDNDTFNNGDDEVDVCNVCYRKQEN